MIVTPPIPPGSRIRFDTSERGIVEFALDTAGASVEKAPEGATVLRAWFVWPDGLACPIDNPAVLLESPT